MKEIDKFGLLKTLSGLLKNASSTKESYDIFMASISQSVASNTGKLDYFNKEDLDYLATKFSEIDDKLLALFDQGDSALMKILAMLFTISRSCWAAQELPVSDSKIEPMISYIAKSGYMPNEILTALLVAKLVGKPLSEVTEDDIMKLTDEEGDRLGQMMREAHGIKDDNDS